MAHATLPPASTTYKHAIVNTNINNKRRGSFFFFGDADGGGQDARNRHAPAKQTKKLTAVCPPEIGVVIVGDPDDMGGASAHTKASPTSNGRSRMSATDIPTI